MVEFSNSFAWFFVVLCNFQPCAEWIRNHQLHPFDPAVGLTFSIFFFSMGWAGCNCTSLSWRKTEGLACCRAQFGPKTTVTIPSKPPWNPSLNHYKKILDHLKGILCFSCPGVTIIYIIFRVFKPWLPASFRSMFFHEKKACDQFGGFF